MRVFRIIMIGKLNQKNMDKMEHQKNKISLKNLFESVESGNIAEVEKTLAEEKLNATEYYGYRSIISATENGYIEILKLLLESSKTIARLSFWATSYHIASSALSRAASHGRADMVKLMLDYGANAEKKDLREAFVEALLAGNLEITKMLLNAGAPVNIKDEKGITPLMYVVLFPNKNQELLIEWLLAAGAHVNVKHENNTALTYAKELGNEKIVEMLKNGKRYRNIGLNNN